MTKIYDVNRIATYGGSTCVFYLKETLKSAGWVVSQSSDGTTFYSASDGITTDNSGSGGMNNNLAWYFIKDPANRRAFSVQRGSGTLETFGLDQMWRVVNYEDVISGIASGSVSRSCVVINVNTALTGCGSGSTTANPLFERMFESSGSFRCHTIAQNTPYNGVYAWYNLTSTTGSLTGRTTSLWHHEPILSSSVFINSPVIYRTQRCFLLRGFGSTMLSNYSPYTIVNQTSPNDLIGGECNAWLSYGELFSKQSKVFITADSTLSAIPFGSSVSSAPLTTYAQSQNLSNDGIQRDVIQMINSISISTVSTQIAALASFKFFGYPAKLRWATRSESTLVGNRRYPDTFNITSDDAYVVAGHFLVPWPTNVAPIS